MKFIKLSIVFLAVLTTMSCNKKMVEDDENLTVEHYIDLLKSGTYEASVLPAFSYDKIPALLEYRNSTATITDFPHNPVSSYYGTECTLGIYVLWTIESIRAISIENESLIMGFPSFNPILGLRNVDEFTLVEDEESHLIAAQAYYDWWYDHDGDNYESFKTIDPLMETDYRW